MILRIVVIGLISSLLWLLLGRARDCSGATTVVQRQLSVDDRSVELFLRLTPLFKEVEDEQVRLLEEIHRRRHYGRSRRMVVEMTDVRLRGEDLGGISYARFRELRREIALIHRAYKTLAAAEARYDALILQWKAEIQAGIAPDEVFTRARELAGADVSRARLSFGKYPPAARSAVERYDSLILVAFAKSVEVREEKKDRNPLPPGEPTIIPSLFVRPNNPLFQRLPDDLRPPELTGDDFRDELPIECHADGCFDEDCD